MPYDEIYYQRAEEDEEVVNEKNHQGKKIL